MWSFYFIELIDMQKILFSVISLLFFYLPATQAHNFGEGGHLIVAIAPDGSADMQFDLTTGEFNKRFNIDNNGDNNLSIEEEQAYPHKKLSNYIASNLAIYIDGKVCDYNIVNHRFMLHGNGNYVRFLLAHECPRPAYEIAAEYNLLFEDNPDHRGSLHLTRNDAMVQNRFFEDQRRQTIELQKVSIANTVYDFIVEGVWHIWIGIDHILFLICLILPSVLILKNQQWVARDSLKEVAIESLKIVTAFTIAHSITLVSAVLGWVDLPPSRATESIIALSVLVVALNCVFPRMDKSLWVITFAFGLIHGFGFANVLLELSMPPKATTIALVAFNIGVELGQLMIVAFTLPLLFLIRKYPFYQPVVLKGGSYLVSATALIWLLERAGDMEIIGFI